MTSLDVRSQPSLIEMKMNEYDADLEKLLKSGQSLSEIQDALCRILVLLNLGAKEIETKVSNGAEEERKRLQKEYCGWFNSYPILVLTFTQVAFQFASLYCSIAPHSTGKMVEGAKGLFGRASVVPSTNPVINVGQMGAGPVVNVTNIAETAVEAAKKLEETSKQWQEIFSKLALITQLFQGIAQAYEEKNKQINYSNMNAIQYQLQNDLYPAKSKKGNDVQQAEQDLKKAVESDTNGKQSLIRG